MNEVHESFKDWLTKARQYFRYKAVADDRSIQGTRIILGELELIGRANIGFDEIMDAREKDDDGWDYEDYQLLLRYAEEDIEPVDVGTIAAQEAINIEVSRKVYDRISANSIPPAVVAPDRVASELGREERRDVRDTLRQSNAAKIAFRQFWDRNRVVEID